MRPARSRRAVASKLAIAAIAVIVVVAIGGALVFLTSGSSATTSQASSTTSAPTVPVNTEVNKLVQTLNQRNVDGMVTYYASNAVVRWSGNTGGLSGLYTGPNDIRLIYATTVGKSSKLSANLTGYSEKVFSPTNINATFQIGLLANSTAAGMVTATINASENWHWNGANWQISKENWNYVRYDSSLIDAGLPHEATTFPQWSVMVQGGNPDLVSEKSFEWHAGPFVAASVYAFLFGIVSFLAIRLWSAEDSRDRNLKEAS